MPTAGEARLKSNSVQKTSQDSVSLKGKISTNKSALVKTKLTQHHNNGKSSIPVPVKKGAAKGKENSNPNEGCTVGKRSSKVKKAPNFSKIHKKWESQLSKGKAVSKKKNTTVEAFNLTKGDQQGHNFKRPYAYISEDEGDAVSGSEDDFEIDSTALKGILNNTGIKDEDLKINGRATIAALPSSESGISGQTAGIRTSIYYTRPTIQRDVTASGIAPRTCDTSTKARPPLTPLQPSNVDITSAISQPGSCIKKKVAWADQAREKDPFDFKPDASSLQSILNNTGINDNLTRLQNTGRVTLAGGRLTPYLRSRQAFREEPTIKRSSIYYTGPKRTRPSPRGSMIRTRLATEAAGKYNPLTTVVGKQGQLQEQDELDPIASLAATQLSTKTRVPDSQPFKSFPLSTPSRILVSRAQPSSAKDQPTWADILTPQRVSQTQATRSQASFDPLRTPRKQEALDEELCTPQRVTSVNKNYSLPQEPIIAVNSSVALGRKPLVDSTTPNSTLLTRQASIPQPVDLQSHHTSMATQAWRPQPSSTIDLNSQYSHTQTLSFPSSVATLSTASRPVPCVSSRQLQPEICTPLSQTGGSKLQLSTLQISSYQPSLKAEASASLTEVRLPQRTPISMGHQEDDVIRQLERQAMEDLGLLQISDRKIHEDSKSVDDDKGEVFCSNVSKALDNRDSVVKKPQACSRPPPTFNSKQPAWEEHLCSGDITSTYLQNDSSFCPPVRLAYPTPIQRTSTVGPVSNTLRSCDSPPKGSQSSLNNGSSFCPPVKLAYPTPVKGTSSVITIPNTLRSDGSLPKGNQQVNSRAMHSNNLSLRSALSSSNPRSLPSRNAAQARGVGEVCSRLRWDEVTAVDDLTSAFRPATSSYRTTAKVKAQEKLLDMEVASYMAVSQSYLVKSLEHTVRPMNPLARQFLEGDSRHFHPINSR